MNTENLPLILYGTIIVMFVPSCTGMFDCGVQLPDPAVDSI